MVMIKYLVAVLFFSFHVVIAMDMDIELADFAVNEQTLLLKKSAINITLLRFDQINKLFAGFSPASRAQAKKNSSSDMSLICDFAMLPKVLREKITMLLFKTFSTIEFENKGKETMFDEMPIKNLFIFTMFNGHQKAIEKFYKKTPDKAFRLYDEIKKSLQDSNKEIGPLFAQPKNDREIALKVFNPLHYSYPIINQFDYEKICSQDQLREYMVGKEVVVVKIPRIGCLEGIPTTGRCRDISSLAGIACCAMCILPSIMGVSGLMLGKTLGAYCCAGPASPCTGGCCCVIKNPLLPLGLPMGAICWFCMCASGCSILETDKAIQKIEIEEKKKYIDFVNLGF